MVLLSVYLPSALENISSTVGQQPAFSTDNGVKLITDYNYEQFEDYLFVLMTAIPITSY